MKVTAMEDWIKSRITNLAKELTPCVNCPVCNTVRSINLPGQKAIIDTLEMFISILFPGCHETSPINDSDNSHIETEMRITKAALQLADQAARAISYYECNKPSCNCCGDCKAKAREAVGKLLDNLPSVRKTLEEDLLAAYEGDPAAKSTMEIVMSYPGFFAITVHRVAHELEKAGVPIIPRVMSEYAHSKTGIDIHPGATIGPGFFIDHGTGVVIGETCTIGRHVKLYQGVTLGARSFAKNPDGTLVKGLKRHPDVEDDVVIYAGATVLGGETVIGKGSIIGASVWVTSSVPPNSKVK